MCYIINSRFNNLLFLCVQELTVIPAGNPSRRQGKPSSASISNVSQGSDTRQPEARHGFPGSFMILPSLGLLLERPGAGVGSTPLPWFFMLYSLLSQIFKPLKQ